MFFCFVFVFLLSLCAPFVTLFAYVSIYLIGTLEYVYTVVYFKHLYK